MRHPAAGGEVADLARIDRRLRAEGEAGEIAHCREVGDLAGHLDPPLILPRNLALAEESHGLAQRQLTPGRLVEHSACRRCELGMCSGRVSWLRRPGTRGWLATRW